jgi:hypothetical protein
VLAVVAAGGVGVDRAQLGRHQAEALALEPGEDLPGEAALHGVGLADHEGAVHKGDQGRTGARRDGNPR